MRLLRQIISILLVATYLSATIFASAPAASAAPCEMSGGMKMQDSASDQMPCKGLKTGCVTELGCVRFPTSLMAGARSCMRHHLRPTGNASILTVTRGKRTRPPVAQVEQDANVDTRVKALIAASEPQPLPTARARLIQHLARITRAKHLTAASTQRAAQVGHAVARSDGAQAALAAAGTAGLQGDQLASIGCGRRSRATAINDAARATNKPTRTATMSQAPCLAPLPVAMRGRSERRPALWLVAWHNSCSVAEFATILSAQPVPLGNGAGFNDSHAV